MKQLLATSFHGPKNSGTSGSCHLTESATKLHGITTQKNSTWILTRFRWVLLYTYSV